MNSYNEYIQNSMKSSAKQRDLADANFLIPVTLHVHFT